MKNYFEVDKKMLSKSYYKDIIDELNKNKEKMNNASKC